MPFGFGVVHTHQRNRPSVATAAAHPARRICTSPVAKRLLYQINLVTTKGSKYAALQPFGVKLISAIN